MYCDTPQREVCNNYGLKKHDCNGTLFDMLDIKKDELVCLLSNLGDNVCGTFAKYNINLLQVIFQLNNNSKHTTNSIKSWLANQPFMS